MKLPREPLNRFDMLWLCGNATNALRQRYTIRPWGPVSRGAARAGRRPEDYSTRRSRDALAGPQLAGTYDYDRREAVDYDLE